MTATTRWTPQEKGLLIRLAGEGKSTKEIAKEIGRTPVAVALKAKHLGIKRARGPSFNTTYALTLLAREDLSPAQLAKELGITRNNVYRTINLLRGEARIHIARWERNHSGPPVPFYRLGPGVDAKYPKPQDPARLQKKYMQRLKRERPDEFYARVKRSNAKRPRKARPDKAAAWLQHPTGE